MNTVKKYFNFRTTLSVTSSILCIIAFNLVFAKHLEVESITVEIDAMTDFQEYRLGVVPGSDDMPYIVVNDVVDNTSTRFYDFTMSSNSGSIVDNSDVSLRTYSAVTITKGNSVAKAAKDSSGNNYKVTVSWYSDSAYTLSSTTITRPVTDEDSDFKRHTK